MEKIEILTKFFLPSAATDCTEFYTTSQLVQLLNEHTGENITPQDVYTWMVQHKYVQKLQSGSMMWCLRPVL